MNDSDVQQMLDAIRALELEIAQDLAEARTRAEAETTEAETRARQLVRDGQDRGSARAEQRYRERVAAATEEAARIDRAATDQARRLTGQLRPLLLDMVDDMVEAVLATGPGEDV